MKTNGLRRRFRRVKRPANRRRLAVELMEDRLVLSSTLPLPLSGPADALVYHQPPQACISPRLSFYPPGPCISPGPSFHSPSPA
jgi:hypothetical protein